MGKFNRDGGRSGGFNRGGFGGGKRFGDRDGKPSMHHAVCSECGNDCEVPFRPTGDRPVYCDNCFAAQKGGSSRGSFDGGRKERRSFEPRERESSNNGKEVGMILEQIKQLSVKVDALTRLVTAQPSVEKSDSVKPKTEEKAKKEVSKAKKETTKKKPAAKKKK